MNTIYIFIYNKSSAWSNEESGPSRHRFSWFLFVFWANDEIVPNFQIAVACFLCSPPDLNVSELNRLTIEVAKLCNSTLIQRIRIALPLSQAVTTNLSDVFTFIPPLWEGRVSEARELFNEMMLPPPPNILSLASRDFPFHLPL
jgi:hypothetical protein